MMLLEFRIGDYELSLDLPTLGLPDTVQSFTRDQYASANRLSFARLLFPSDEKHIRLTNAEK